MDRTRDLSVDGRPQSAGHDHGRLRGVAHAGARGAIAAMAMTGMRAFTVDIGIVEQAPPEAIIKQKARGLIRRVPRDRRPAAIELAHWGYGAAGGAAFGMLPDRVRLRPWAGPAQARNLRLVEPVALAADHLLYGLILSEIRRRPQA